MTFRLFLGKIKVALQHVTFNCPHIPTIKVTGEDYVLFKYNGINQCVRKFLRINIIESKNEVQMFVFPKNITNNQNIIPVIDTTVYSFIGGIPDVVETNRTKLINIQSVVDYLFVFHMESLKSSLYICHGMANAYFV